MMAGRRLSLARRLLLARLLVCLSVALCVLAAELLMGTYVSLGAAAESAGKPERPVVRTGGGVLTQGNAAAKPTLSPDDPVRLVIPSIGINAPVEMLGIQPDGDLATPTQHPWDDVGWYAQGPHPGERGSAVIDGHLDRPGGYPAVFWRLRDIQVGEDVQVTNTAGKTLHFRVTRVIFFAPDQAPLQDIFGNQGGTYLNLITCAGDWIPSQHQTNLRLVVFTTLV